MISPLAIALPSKPPSFPLRYVDLLPRKTGTSIPPEIQRLHLHPLFALSFLKEILSPSLRLIQVHEGQGAPFICIPGSAPAAHTIPLPELTVIEGPRIVISSAAASSSFPTIMLPILRAM